MKTIPGFPNYLVTETGCVWSKKRTTTKGGWLKLGLGRDGYWRVSLMIQGLRHIRRVHSLVLEAYVGPCPDSMECRHLNGYRQDNRLDNIKWGTRSENRQDAIRHGTQSKPWLGKRGEKCPNSKLSDQDRRLIFSVYHDGAYEQQELADLFDVGYSTIHRIVRDNCWKELGGK